MPRLAGKTALITGAAIARAFITEGARHVRITDIDDAAGRETASSLGAAARYDPVDVRDEAGWRRVTTALLDEFGALDIVVNHAGITGFEAAPRCPRLRVAAKQRRTRRRLIFCCSRKPD